MADGLSIKVDPSALIAALEALPERVRLEAVLPQANRTAQRIMREARGRIHRRTGKTAAGIRIVGRRDGQGYRVETDTDPDAGRPISLEFGTATAEPRPFLFAAADLEAQDHDRRMRDAIQFAIGGNS